MAEPKPYLPIITGLTASGKTSLAIDLVEALQKQGKVCEIVCCDSMLVYRHLNIGTAKPSDEDCARIPHHCINLVDPNEGFSLGDYIQAARQAISEINDRGHMPLLVGGTGLYLRGVLKGLVDIPEFDVDRSKAYRAQLNQEVNEKGDHAFLYKKLQAIDPDCVQNIHPNDLYRIIRALEVFEFTGRTLSSYQNEHAFKEDFYRTNIIAIDWPRELLYERVNLRLQEMLASGLMSEIKFLLDEQGYDVGLRCFQALAYHQFIKVYLGEISEDEALAKTQQESRRFAKRQATWFRKLKEIHWLPSSLNREQLCTQSAKILFSQ